MHSRKLRCWLYKPSSNVEEKCITTLILAPLSTTRSQRYTSGTTHPAASQRHQVKDSSSVSRKLERNSPQERLWCLRGPKGGQVRTAICLQGTQEVGCTGEVASSWMSIGHPSRWQAGSWRRELCGHLPCATLAPWTLPAPDQTSGPVLSVQEGEAHAQRRGKI